MGALFRGLLIVLALVSVPIAAPAQSVFFPPPGGGGSPVNPQIQSSELLGSDANGPGVPITASTSTYANCTLLGATSFDWAGFRIYHGSVATSTGRYAVQLYTDNTCSGAPIVPHLFLDSGAGGPMFDRFLPLNVASGTSIYAAVRASAATAVRVAVRGLRRDGNSPPYFNSMSLISTLDTANWVPSSVDIPLATSGSTTFTPQVTLGGACGAILAVPTRSATTPATAQFLKLAMATGGSGSEVTIHELATHVATSAAPFPRAPTLLMERTFASGTILSAQAIVPLPGSDTIRVGLYCFN